MTLLIPGRWGLTLIGAAVRVAASVLVMWTYAKSNGYSEELLQGVRGLPSVLWNGLHLAVTPGGGEG